MQKTWAYSVMLGACLATATVGVMPASANWLASLFGQGSTQPKFLPVHEAFAVTPSQMGDELVVQFTVTPKHYVYQERLSLKLPEGVTAEEWQFDKTPSIIDDPTFGVVPVFEENVTARARLTSANDIHQQEIGIRWQGCAKAGLCYPPETTTLKVSLAGTAGDEAPLPVPATAQPEVAPTAPSVIANEPDTQSKSADLADNEESAQTHQQPVPTASAQPLESDDGRQAVYQLDHTLPDSQTPDLSPLIMILLLFVAGLLLAFTPCIYPMVPIVANIVAKQHAKANAKRGFMLSAAYGIGVASAYGLLGALIAWFGQALGIAAWLQRAEVLMVAAALFVLFALMMFGWVNVRLPSVISDKLTAGAQAADGRLGTLGGSYVAGLLSSLVVSPCVSAPMAGALTMVAASGQVWFGFLALFMLGLGLSVPLMLLGALQGKWMPKTGAWMQHVRTLGGFLLLAVALLLIERVLLTSAMLGLWAVWFLGLAFWLYISVGRHSRVVKCIAILPMLWAMLLVYGISIGSKDAWRPWYTPKISQAQSLPDIRVYTLDELDQVLSVHDRVLVDVTADWCIQCRIMERTLFGDRPDELHAYQVVKLDITETNEHSRAILARYELSGPPALLIYHQGKLKQVLLGETKPDAFKAALSDTP